MNITITSEYKDKVLETFKIRPLGKMELNKANDHYEKFVEAIKVIIDWGQDIDNGFWLEFNNDYTLVKKMSIN